MRHPPRPAPTPSHPRLNELTKEEDEALWRKLLDKFKEPMILLLLGSAAVSLLVGSYDDAISITLVRGQGGPRGGVAHWGGKGWAWPRAQCPLIPPRPFPPSPSRRSSLW